jgi:DNA primase
MGRESLLPLSAENIIKLLKNEFNLAFNKRGQDYFAFCPLHKEKTSSFAFEPGKKIFKCFGCGFGVGNVFKL